ncbi:MAG: DUF1176 domain-containing protein [bacterium]
MTEKNPFKKDDGFIEILKNNPKIKDLSQSNFNQFIQKNNMPNNSQPTTTSTYLKLVHFVTKNAFVSTIVMFLLLGTLGVSAAQVFAPESNKPSTLLGGKKFSSSSSQSSSSVTNNIASLYKGRINNDLDGQEVEVSLDFAAQIADTFTGKIRYLNSNTIFDLKGKYDQGSGFGCLIIEEYTDIKLSATLSTCGNPQAIISRDDYFSNNYNVLTGKYIMADPNKAYDFKLVKVGYEEEKKKTSVDLTTKSSAELRQIFPWSKDCSSLVTTGLINTLDKEPGDKVFKVNDNGFIVRIICNLSAYQGNYLIYYYNSQDNKITLQNFEIYNYKKEKSTASGLLGYPNFDEKTLILTNFEKYRGLGDCGLYSKYKFENYKFILSEARLKVDCDGTGNFETFPLIYPDNKNTSTTQTYENPFFPNFKLVYPDGWKLETSTNQSIVPEFLETKISLSKDNYKIKFDLTPNTSVNCFTNPPQDPNKYSKQLVKSKSDGTASDIYKYTYISFDQVEFFYAIDPFCKNLHSIATNVIGYDVKDNDFRTTVGLSNNVRYRLSANVEGFAPLGGLTDRDGVLLKELDQIISQSTFN